MSLVLVYGDRFSGERELAQSLAEGLGCRLLARDVVVERAAAWGGSQEKLARVFTESPRWIDRFLCSTRAQLLLLRAAVAEEVRNGDMVCFGEVADVLLQEDIPLIRVRITASVESRISTVRALLKFSDGEAAAYLRHADRARTRCLRLMHGPKQAEPVPDLVIGADRSGVHEACDRIAAFVHRRGAEGCPGSDGSPLTDFALSSRVSATLSVDPATAHLSLSVAAERGRVSIRGRPREAQDLDEVARVVRSLHGVSEVSFNGEQLELAALRQVIADRGGFSWRRPRLAFVALGLTLAVVLLFSSLPVWFGHVGQQAVLSRWDQHSETIVGVVTDSQCGARHSQADNAQCVRACVARGAKYVLDDGSSRYELIDQRGAERYAARHVRVRGVLEKGARYFKVASIELL